MDNDKPPSKTPPKKETPPVIEEPKKTQVQTKETPLTQQEIAKKLENYDRMEALLKTAEEREQTLKLDEYNLDKSKVLGKIAQLDAVMAEECKEEHLNKLEDRLDTLIRSKDPNAKTPDLKLGASDTKAPEKKKGYFDRVKGKYV